MSSSTAKTRPVPLVKQLATLDRRFARYQRHAAEVIANAGVLSVNSDAMDAVFEVMPRNGAGREASRLCQQMMEYATDPTMLDLASDLDSNMAAAINEERDRAYTLGLAVGLELANAGKGGAR